MRAALHSEAWARYPRASGAAIAWALRHVGLEARVGGPDHAILFRDGVEVATVPLRDNLHPAIVRALLRTLGVSADELARYLDATEEPG